MTSLVQDGDTHTQDIPAEIVDLKQERFNFSLYPFSLSENIAI